MKKIVLLCAGGLSTSMLMEKMIHHAKEKNYECNLSAYGKERAKEVAADADIVLLGPQIKFALNEVKSQLPNTRVEVINMQDYGLQRGDKIMDYVIEQLKEDN